MNDQTLELQIKQLIATDELGPAVQLLSEHFSNHPKLDELILQSGGYHSLLRDRQKGIAPYAEVQKSRDQLRAGLSAFLKQELKKHEIISAVQDEVNTEKMAEKLRLSLARLSILAILKNKSKHPKGLTISGIYKPSKIKSRKNIYESLVEMEQAGLIAKNNLGKRSYWKLTEEGDNLVEEFAESVLFNPKKDKT